MTTAYLNCCLDNLREIAEIIEAANDHCKTVCKSLALTRTEILEIYKLSKEDSDAFLEEHPIMEFDNQDRGNYL